MGILSVHLRTELVVSVEHAGLATPASGGNLPCQVCLNSNAPMSGGLFLFCSTVDACRAIRDLPWVVLVSDAFLVFFPAENTFCSGDHVSWHSPLDNSESRIQHMLLTEDPQMQPVQTPFGVVTFLQVRQRNGWSSCHPLGAEAGIACMHACVLP